MNDEHLHLLTLAAHCLILLYLVSQFFRFFVHIIIELNYISFFLFILDSLIVSIYNITFASLVFSRYDCNANTFFRHLRTIAVDDAISQFSHCKVTLVALFFVVV